MAKWADYCISAVKYASTGDHIDRVRVHVDSDTGVGPGKEYTRTEVVKLLDQGKSFITITRTSDGKWSRGAAVQIFPVLTNYLKTTADKTTKDNLEKLPNF
jgi:hypothetical protein